MGDLLAGTPKQKRRGKPDKPKKAASSDDLFKTGGGSSTSSFIATPGEKPLAESNEETQTYMLDEDKKAKKVKLPTLFQKEKIVLGELCVVIKNGILNTNIKGIQSRLQCVIVIENQVGQTVDEIGNKEWNTEFIFPVSEHYEQIEIELNVSRIDLVTQEMRWVRLAGTSIEIQLLEMMKERDPRHVNVGLGKVKKGKPSAEVNLELMFRPHPDIYAPLEKLLFSEDDKLPRALFETFKSDYDGPDVAKPLLIAFWFNGKEKELLKLAIQHEVAFAEDPVQLLRGVTLSVKLLSEYLKILCEPFILQLLQPLIKPLAMQGASNLGKYEVDPMRINPPLPEKEMKNNQKKLTSVTEKFLKSITASHSKLPAELPELCRYLEAEVHKRFPGKESVALGALIFLRFICPSIVAPETAGLLPGDCKTELRRVLVLVTKVLQNIANEVTFGEKEGYMECMNPFVLKNSGKMKDFYAHILKAKMKDTIDRKQLLRGVPEENLEQIYAYCKKNLADLSASVPKEIATALTEALASIELAREARQQMQQTLSEETLKDDKKPERRLSMVPLLDKVRGSESGASTPQGPRKKDGSPLSTSLPPTPKNKKVSRSSSNHSSPHASCDEFPTVHTVKGSVSLDDVPPVPSAKKSNPESGEVEATD